MPPVEISPFIVNGASGGCFPGCRCSVCRGGGPPGRTWTTGTHLEQRFHPQIAKGEVRSGAGRWEVRGLWVRVGSGLLLLIGRVPLLSSRRHHRTNTLPPRVFLLRLQVCGGRWEAQCASAAACRFTAVMTRVSLADPSVWTLHVEGCVFLLPVSSSLCREVFSCLHASLPVCV